MGYAHVIHIWSLAMIHAKDVANYFLLLEDEEEGDGISNLKLQKLVYYAQGFFLAIFNRPLFPENIEAWTHGPVVPSLYHAYKEYGSCTIPIDEEFDPNTLNKDVQELIEEIYEVFGQFSAWKLRNMTHEEPPWVAHEEYGETIPLEELSDYFKTRIK
jgi:uncharacterized phage-associated protein